MKISFIFLVVCVVYSFAMPELKRFGKSAMKEQGEEQQQINVNHDATNEPMDRRNVNLHKINFPTLSQIGAEGNRRMNWNRRRNNQRNGEGLVDVIRGTESNREGQRQLLKHNTILQETQTLLPGHTTSGSEETERRHHRHHHHHRNRTTTTTTTTPSTPLSEVEEVALYQRLTSN